MFKKTLVDLGKMKVSDEKTAEFTIKNTGTKPLQVSDMNSSCNCTLGQFIYQEKTSTEFGMHSPSDYLGDIAPNTEAKIKVIYRHSIMPVYEPVRARGLFIRLTEPATTKISGHNRQRFYNVFKILGAGIFIFSGVLVFIFNYQNKIQMDQMKGYSRIIRMAVFNIAKNFQNPIIDIGIFLIILFIFYKLLRIGKKSESNIHHKN